MVVSLIVARAMVRRRRCSLLPWMVAVVLFGPLALAALALFVRRRADSGGSVLGSGGEW